MNKFNPMKTRFRATYGTGSASAPRLGTVDRDSGVLHDVQITLEGEAKGHDVWLDRAFCEDVVAAGNKAGEAGVKVRFGHPGMCADALGTYLGRAVNFRLAEFNRKCVNAEGVEEEVAAAGVIADVYLDKNADRYEWILNMSESAPDTFGQSIVFTYADWKVKDSAGVEHSYYAECVEGVEDPDSKTGKKVCKSYKEWAQQSADGRVYAVLGKLHGTDFTDSPAATDGVFSDTSLAAEAERMLDEHPQIAEVLAKNPDSVYQFLSRVGILDKIESRRVSGLQAEKDREIASLKTVLAEKEALLKKTVDASKEELARCEEKVHALSAELEAAQNDLVESRSALTASNDAREQLGRDLDESKQALAEMREQLARLKERHADVIGSALNAVKDVPRYTDFAAAVDALGYSAACRQYPELRAAYRRTQTET